MPLIAPVGSICCIAVLCHPVSTNSNTAAHSFGKEGPALSRAVVLVSLVVKGVIAQTRRLAAILAADVVGCSRLMGEDEGGTTKAVREHREAATPVVRELGGRLVKTTGDGVLLEFPSVVAAVECAIAIQKQMAERSAGVPEAKRIVYRMGINLGDVLIEGDDILGDGVNIAARLEAIAEPGGIYISGSAYDQVRGRIEADFTDLGEQNLKNILILRPLQLLGSLANRSGAE